MSGFVLMAKPCWVYIMASPGTLVLYAGVSSDLETRVYQHKTGATGGFTSKYNCTLLVYFEELDGPKSAIEREKQIKTWRREKKTKLIRSVNPEFKDLSEGWYGSSLHSDQHKIQGLSDSEDSTNVNRVG